MFGRQHPGLARSGAPVGREWPRNGGGLPGQGTRAGWGGGRGGRSDTAAVAAPPDSPERAIEREPLRWTQQKKKKGEVEYFAAKVGRVLMARLDGAGVSWGGGGVLRRAERPREGVGAVVVSPCWVHNGITALPPCA